MRYLFGVLAALCLAWLPAGSDAAAMHKQHEALTTIEWNERTGFIEIIHRMHTHHLEPIVFNSKDGGLYEINDAGRIRGAQYVADRFAMAADGWVLDLVTLGTEVDGDFTYVYQEIAMDSPPSELIIENRIMHDHFDDQTNQVNINMGGGVRTLLFRINRPIQETGPLS